MIDMLTTAEVAERLRCSRDTVRRLCAQKTLIATKVGRQYLIAEKDLQGFLNQHRGGATPPARTDRPKRGHRRVA